VDALICSLGTNIDYLWIDGMLVDCRQTHATGLVEDLRRRRDAETAAWLVDARQRLMRNDDAAERDAWLGAENQVADWHRQYRAKLVLDEALDKWRAAKSRVLVVGTRQHSACLYLYVPGMAELDVRGFVALDDLPAERHEFDVWPSAALPVDWSQYDAVLV